MTPNSPARHSYLSIDVAARRLCFAALFCILASAALTLPASAQQSLGVQWDIPADKATAESQLFFFRDLGIDRIEISGAPDEETWAIIDSLGFTVYGDLSVRFPITATFSDPDSLLVSRLSSRINSFASRSSVKAIGLFSYGHIDSELFQQALSPWLQQIRTAFQGEIYYKTAQSGQKAIDSLFDFKLLRLPEDSLSSAKAAAKGYLHVPGAGNRISPVKGYLEKARQDSVSLFFRSGWLTDAVDRYPPLRTALQTYARSGEILMPLPQEPNADPSQQDSIIALLIVLIWGSFVLNYSFNPVYRKAIFRYFSAHKFFIDDVMQRHIRSAASVIVILVQHAFLTGITIYCLAKVSFSLFGMEVFAQYVPFLFLGQASFIPLIMWGFLFSAVFSILCLIWLRGLNKEITQFSQALNLYAWPLQLNLILCTLSVAFLMAGTTLSGVYVTGILFFLVFLSAFVVASLDAARFVKNKKVLVLLGTTGLYLVAWSGLLLWIFSRQELLDIVDLALMLS